MNGRALALIGAISTPCALVLGLWATRTGVSWIHWLDAVGSVTFTLAFVAFGWWLSGKFTADVARRGLVALVAGIWSPATAGLRLLMSANVHDVFRSAWLVPALWTFWCVAACWIAIRTRRQLDAWSRFAAAGGVVLLVGQLIEIWPEPKPKAPTESPQPLSVASADAPNIYLLVLDKLTSGAWLKHTYGVDVSAYEDSLRDLGFSVPRRARANYAHTHLSLASFLNWRYLDAEVDGEGGLPWGRTQDLVRTARTWSEARANGYRVVTFPNWYPTTRQIDGASVLTRVIKPTPAGFGETWLLNSPVEGIVAATCTALNCGLSLPFPHESLAELNWKLETFATMADSAGPSLTFLHLLLPHEPYLFAEGCTLRDPWWPRSDQEDSAAVEAAYAIQVGCTMPLILRTVREILQREKVPPVIIVQGDHGHGRLFVDVHSALTLDVREVSVGQLGERMSVFGAYYLPVGSEAVSDSVSLVNVLRMVARTTWADTTPPLPDSVYFSSYQSGFSFTRVRPAVLDTPTTPRGPDQRAP